MTAPVRRPGLVTLLVVLVIISGLLSVFGGIALLFLRSGDDGVVIENASTFGLVGGICAIVIGLIYLAVAKGLSNGNNASRLVVAIVSVLSIVGGVWIAISQTGRAGLSGWSSAFWGVVILLILYSPKANAFFAGRGGTGRV